MNALLVLLIEVTATFAVALLAARLAARMRAAVRHLILASAFGVALCLPLAALVSPKITVEIAALPARDVVTTAAMPLEIPVEAPVDAPLDVTAEVSASPVEIIPAATTAPPFMQQDSIPVTTWLLLAWAIIAWTALIPVGANLWHMRGLRHRGRPWPEGTVQLQQLAQPDATQEPAVLLHDDIGAPIAGGIFHPVIVLPADAIAWSEAQLANALMHEMEHVRRHDWAVHLGARAVLALYWFHPLVWLAWHALRLEAERSADDAVLVRADAATYAEQLLELARRLAGRPALPGMHMASDSKLSSRIKAVLDSTLPRGRAGRIAVAGVVIAAAVAVTVLAPLRPVGPLREDVQPAQTPSTAAAPVTVVDPLQTSALISIAAPSLPPESPRASSGPDRTRPPVVAASTGGFTIRKLAAPVIVDGKLWIGVDQIWGNKPYTAPNGQFTVSLNDENEEGDIARYHVMFTAAGGKPVNLIPDVAGFAFVTPDSRWIFMEPLEVVDVKTWRRYRLAEKLGVSPYIFRLAISADGQRLALSRQDCPFDCGQFPNEYYEITFPAASAIERAGNMSNARTVASPRAIVADILELVQSALAEKSTSLLDEVARPITGLHHVQRHAQAVLADNSNDPANLAGNYLEVINALANTANLATSIAARPPDPGLSPPRLRQLAAAMREKSAELTAALMPASPIRSAGSSTPERNAARVALDIVQTTRDDTQFVDPVRRSWLNTELVTLDRVARSYASDDGWRPEATTLKLNLLRRSIQTTVRQANEIAGRNNEAAEARRKATELATSLRNIEGRLDGRFPAQGGQQISFRVPGTDIEQTRISGDNQYDRHVTWDSARFGPLCDASRCDEVRARNWWFKGKVTVEYRLRGDRATYSCHFYVNERQAGNRWVDLLAPERGVSAHGAPDKVSGSLGRCRATSSASEWPQ